MLRKILIASIAAFLLAGMLLVLLTCMGNDKGKVESSLGSDLDGIGNGQPEALEMLGEQLAVGEQFGVAPGALAAVWFEGYAYEVDDVVVDGETATAEVTITSRRLQPAIEKALPQIAAVMDDPPDDADLDALYAQCGQILLDSLAGEPLVTTTLTLTYHLEDGTWVMDTTSKKALSLALMGR